MFPKFAKEKRDHTLTLTNTQNRKNSDRQTVTDDTRIRASIPNIEYLIDKGANVTV